MQGIGSGPKVVAVDGAAWPRVCQHRSEPRQARGERGGRSVPAGPTSTRVNDPGQPGLIHGVPVAEQLPSSVEPTVHAAAATNPDARRRDRSAGGCQSRRISGQVRLGPHRRPASSQVNDLCVIKRHQPSGGGGAGSNPAGGTLHGVALTSKNEALDQRKRGLGLRSYVRLSPAEPRRDRPSTPNTPRSSRELVTEQLRRPLARRTASRSRPPTCSADPEDRSTDEPAVHTRLRGRAPSSSHVKTAAYRQGQAGYTNSFALRRDVREPVCGARS